MKGQRIALLKGGNSPERGGSLETGAVYAHSLRESGNDVTEIDVDLQLAERLIELKPDVVFIGGYGGSLENGQVQGLVECLGLPYTHSGVLASALSMNKARCREVFLSNNVPVADGRLIHVNELKLGHPLEPPYVLKPNAEGSSVGVRVIHDKCASLTDLVGADFEWMIAEKYIQGHDLTVSVFEDKALEVCEIRTPCGIWDYDAKHSVSGVERLAPAPVPDDVRTRCLELAQLCHNVIGCHNVSRTDFRWDEEKHLDGIVVLETNTQPGMEKPETAFWKCLSAHGIDISMFSNSLLNSANLKSR